MALQPTLRRLLVIEDDPDQCQALRDRLELYGYAVSCAEDGSAAMEMLQKNSFHGVLLDLNLPKISGDQVLVRARQTYPDLPVLIMSASQTRIRAAKASNAGACGYISKPFGIKELKQALHSCFGPVEQPLAS
ncbi:MAG TPA: response regulator [Nitrospiraceae bacterium]|nr:response regulator [Nitrospiraceae bacterium]